MKLNPKEAQPLVTLTSYIESKSSQTLLEFLVSRFKYLSPEEWADRVKTGAVLVNDHQASENQPLRAGDKVDYTTSSWEEPEVNPNYRILHEDEALVIVSKPSPLPVHAIGAYFQNTLMTLLRRDRPEARNWHLVHRLDSETSGLIALVKDGKLLKNLQKKWTVSPKPNGTLTPVPSRQSLGGQALSPQGRGNLVDAPFTPPSPLAGEGRVRGDVSSSPSPLRGEGGAIAPGEGAVVGVVKTYRAIVFGKFPAGKKVVDGAIGPKRGSKVRMKLAVVEPSDPEAKASSTEFDLVEAKGNFSLIEARPLTGRTHQIRLHLESIGFPIVGDKLYSGDDETFLHFYDNGMDAWMKQRVLLPRVALHAFRLEFNHPVTGKPAVFEDPLPEDLSDFWSVL